MRFLDLIALFTGAVWNPFLAVHYSLVLGSSNIKAEKRAGPGATCGFTSGNVGCDTGLCCSEAGTCGTGTAFCGGPGCQLSFGPACDGNQVPAGPDTSKTPRPTFGSVPNGVDISHCSITGKVALTFDDGPYIYTTELLDLLQRNNVRATFFIVGNNAGKGQISDASSGYKSIIQRMITDGHQVASHTWSHQDLNAATPQQRRAQIINNEIALSSVLGVFPTYFRPPYTRCGSDCYGELKSLGYRVVNYDIDTRDWQDGGVNAKSTYETILTQHSAANSGWISLAHDVQEFTVHELTQFMIDKARALGYDLVTVGDCLGDPSANWYRDPITGERRDAKGVTPSQTTSISSPPASSESRTITAPSTQSTTKTSTSVTPTKFITPTPVTSVNFGIEHQTLYSSSFIPLTSSFTSTTALSTSAVFSTSTSNAPKLGPWASRHFMNQVVMGLFSKKENVAVLVMSGLAVLGCFVVIL
ncbi:hypothetical protein B0T25DRAFT_536720 [Lasiosphaeria hispida]|uniref:Glycoside hydrolase/deacetylase n=1 Tax=Lasiosphaeria hispida TaxID=260671 RepID=A0AAJ0HK89_9PEZI|nr:hypothetical protein B0T25DRAFT_536720 [Lasiosphaeria hispida]